MRICIVGAGAIGGMLGARLALAGHAVSLILRGAHLAAVRADGLTLITENGEQLQALRQRILDGAFVSGDGSVERARVEDEYIEAVTREVQLARPLRVVVDGGNGPRLARRCDWPIGSCRAQCIL